MFGRCCRELTESSPEVYQDVHREFTDRLLRAHREFTGRMLGVRQEFVEENWELVKGSLEGCREFIESSGGHMHVVCMQMWLAATKPLAGAVGHGLATYKGRPATARPLGAAARKGLLPVASPAASRGGGAGRRGGRPLAGWLPTEKGSCRLCRGSGGGGTVRVKEGWGIFLRKRWLCPS
ncbi:hypothetical protein GW17_00042028 [Ensete ventricosum]|nr:hypothetical protein GW17_00042028 [Ensete ventricosum]